MTEISKCPVCGRYLSYRIVYRFGQPFTEDVCKCGYISSPEVTMTDRTEYSEDMRYTVSDRTEIQTLRH